MLDNVQQFLDEYGKERSLRQIRGFRRVIIAQYMKEVVQQLKGFQAKLENLREFL